MFIKEWMNMYVIWSKECFSFFRVKFRRQVNCTRNLKVLKQMICVPESIMTRKPPFKKPHNSSFSLLSLKDCLWKPKCIRFGWFLPYSPTDHEYGAWKHHYIACVSNLDWLTPREAAAVYGTLNEPKTEDEELQERQREKRLRKIIWEKIALRKSEWHFKTSYLSQVVSKPMDLHTNSHRGECCFSGIACGWHSRKYSCVRDKLFFSSLYVSNN